MVAFKDRFTIPVSIGLSPPCPALKRKAARTELKQVQEVMEKLKTGRLVMTYPIITDPEILKGLGEGSAIRTNKMTRVKTHSSDEWDMVMTSEEVVAEGKGSVALVFDVAQSEDRARNSLLELAAQLIAVSTDREGTLAERMSDRFPWMLALSVEDRELCAAQILATAQASFATKQPHLAIAELTAWRETATAMAAGLDKKHVEWLNEDDTETVPRP